MLLKKKNWQEIGLTSEDRFLNKTEYHVVYMYKQYTFFCIYLMSQ